VAAVSTGPVDLRPSSAAGGLLDADRPNAARVYDCLLGGFFNFAADRDLAARISAAAPSIAQMARANRYFLHRAVRYCLGSGVRQFLDIGSGLPGPDLVHEVVQRVDPAARVAYVDIDPVVVALTRSVLAGSQRACAITGDVRQPEAILTSPELNRVLDLGQPVAVLLASVLHFLNDADDPAEAARRLLAPLPAGSHLVVSHADSDGPSQSWEAVNRICQPCGTRITARSDTEVARLFAGLKLVAPGVVCLPDWRPGPAERLGEQAGWSGGLCGVGVKR